MSSIYWFAAQTNLDYVSVCGYKMMVDLHGPVNVCASVYGYRIIVYLFLVNIIDNDISILGLKYIYIYILEV